MRSILPLVVFMLMAAAGVLRADEAEDRAQDIAQMKRVWEALMAYKTDRGALPEKLGDLVPKYLANAKDLKSPRDDGQQENGPLTLKEEKHPSSYGYEWGPQRFRNLTFSEVKTCQVEEYGTVVPLLRCFLYGPVLNISHAGDFYETDTNWEISPAVEEIIAKRGLGPGTSKGKFLDLVVTDAADQPLEGVKVTVQDRFIQGIWLPTRVIASGKDGHVRIPFGPVDAMSGTLLFEKAGHFAFPQESPTFPSTLRVALQRARPVSGKITTPDGKPISNAAVLLQRVIATDPPPAAEKLILDPIVPRADKSRISQTQSDADGNWKLESIPDQSKEKIRLTVSHPEWVLRESSLDGVELEKEGYFDGRATLVLRKPFSVRGKIVNPDGKPASGANLFLYAIHDPTAPSNLVIPIEGVTDTEGRFELKGRVAGPGMLAILPKSGAAPALQNLNMSDGMQPQEIQLNGGRILNGKVTNARKMPVPDVPIYFSGWSNTLKVPMNPVIATTDSNGDWTWKNAPQDKGIWGNALRPSGFFSFWEDQGNNVISITLPAGEE